MKEYSRSSEQFLVLIQGNSAQRIPFSGTPTLHELLKKKKILFSAPCAGNGRCGGCRVKIKGCISEPDKAEKELLAQSGCEKDIRLACRVRLLGQCTATIPPAPEPHLEHDGKTAERLSVAIDLGTTSISAAFIDSDSGETLLVETDLNALRVFGADVMSRIAECEKPGGLRQMHSMLSKQLNDMIARGALACGVADRLERLVLTGNTVMLHLAAGLDPAPMGRAPYQPGELFGRTVSAEQTGLFEDAYFMPCTGGFTGGDLTACLAAFNLKEGDLLCDLGTNGEIAFRHEKKYYITSAAAGPALEGGCISCGSGAADGAISRITEQNRKLIPDVIGGGKARTICGGALVSAAEIMLKRGIIDPSGRMNGESFHIADDVRITAQDIRQLQLAKGAVAAAMLRTVHFSGAQYGDVKRIFITGGLGSFTSLKSAKAIGLIPKELDCPAYFAPALALKGAVMCLNDKGRSKAERIAAQCVPLALDSDEGFEEVFIDNMEFD